ncbi:MAG: MBL fold metallo-hydrolase [Candidatus Omnitrophica bacterium]|nr:MBL fold metallo-hydrolase [Candidatus Omnitrophota bacterium]
MIRIRILGSAAGIPTRKRFNTSIAVSVEKRVYLFDAGGPVSSLLIRNGIDWNKIKAVFISHLHSDHISGIPQLIQSMQLTKRKKELPLFLPQGGIKVIKEYLKLLRLDQHFLPFKLKVSPLQEKFSYRDKKIKVSAFPTTHLLESYGFFIQTKKKKVLYSADIGVLGDIERFDNLDLLILEFAHIKPEETFSFLSSKKIKKIVLTHIHPDLDDKEKEILALSPPSLKKKLIIASDGLQLNL